MNEVINENDGRRRTEEIFFLRQSKSKCPACCSMSRINQGLEFIQRGTAYRDWMNSTIGYFGGKDKSGKKRAFSWNDVIKDWEEIVLKPQQLFPKIGF